MKNFSGTGTDQRRPGKMLDQFCIGLRTCLFAHSENIPIGGTLDGRLADGPYWMPVE